jgi:hypothetical protein
MVVVPHGGMPEGVVERPRWLFELTLGPPLGRHSWVVFGDGVEGVARRIAVPGTDGSDPAELFERTTSLIGPPGPALLPVIGLGIRQGRLWLVSELDRGVALERFAEVVRVSPAQAFLLASDVLSGIVYLHGTGRVHGRMHAGNVQVGLDGVARLADWALGDVPVRDGVADRRRADLTGTAAVVDRLVAASRCPAGARTEEAGLLLRLSRALRSRSAADDLNNMLTRVAAATGDGVRRGDLRQELQALVSAATRSRSPSWPAGPHGNRTASTRQASSGVSRGNQGIPSPPVVRLVTPPDNEGWGLEPEPVSPRKPGPTRMTATFHRVTRVTRGLWGLVVAVAVLGLVVTVEVTFLHGPITRDLQTLRGGIAGKTAGTRVTRPIPLAGPEIGAGPVRVLDVRPLQSCVAGRPCPVRVLVDFAPQAKPLSVSWTFEVIDRCSGASVSRRGGDALLPAEARQLVRLGSVQVPGWRAPELVALTTGPVAARSAGFPIPPSVGVC